MLRPGSSQVSSAAASDVEMEGSIEQRHMLDKARRKRPPEDHVDCEWKRQKDSDFAGQYSSPISDEISREVKLCIEVDIEVLKTKKLSQKKRSNFFTAESMHSLYFGSTADNIRE